MSSRHGHSLSSPASLETLRARNSRESTARPVPNTTNDSTVHHGLDLPPGYDWCLEPCSPVLSIPRQRLHRSSKSLGMLAPMLFDQPFLTAGARDIPWNAHAQEVWLGAGNEASGLGTFDQPYNPQHSIRGERTPNTCPSADPRQDPPSIWQSGSRHKGRTEVGGTQILGSSGFLSLGPRTSTTEEEATGSLRLGQVGTSLSRTDHRALWQPGEHIEPSVYDGTTHADISGSSFSGSARKRSLSGNRRQFHIHVRGSQPGTTESSSETLGGLGYDTFAPNAPEQLLEARSSLCGKRDGSPDPQVSRDPQGEVIRSCHDDDNDILQVTKDFQSERGPTHPERGVRTLSRTSDQDDRGSHGAQNPTPRDIFQYTRLFFEWGDDYDVCHSKGKKEGAREFKHLTDVLVQRGATLARDGRYFSTPALERFIEEETVSSAERSFYYGVANALGRMGWMRWWH
jgi:hypothetical protein